MADGSSTAAPASAAVGGGLACGGAADSFDLATPDALAATGSKLLSTCEEPEVSLAELGDRRLSTPGSKKMELQASSSKAGLSRGGGGDGGGGGGGTLSTPATWKERLLRAKKQAGKIWWSLPTACKATIICASTSPPLTASSSSGIRRRQCGRPSAAGCCMNVLVPAAASLAHGGCCPTPVACAACLLPLPAASFCSDGFAEVVAAADAAGAASAGRRCLVCGCMV